MASPQQFSSLYGLALNLLERRYPVSTVGLQAIRTINDIFRTVYAYGNVSKSSARQFHNTDNTLRTTEAHANIYAVEQDLMSFNFRWLDSICLLTNQVSRFLKIVTEFVTVTTLSLTRTFFVSPWWFEWSGGNCMQIIIFTVTFVVYINQSVVEISKKRHEIRDSHY